jgi:peptide/nickel transport system permease protein
MSTSEPVVDLAGVENVPAGAEGRLRDAFVLLRANKLALVGLVLTILFLLIGIAGAVILLTPSLHHLWEEQRLAEALQTPSSSHPLGTDQYGRDLMWRAIGGVGIAVLIGVGVTAVVIVTGLALGSIAGYFGGKRETAIAGLIDLTWGFPLLLVAVIIAGMIGKGLVDVVIAVAVILWAGFARIIRAQVKTLSEREFVEAARMLGVSDWRILMRHMIPNVMGTVLVMASYYVAWTVIAEAGFSFINLGAQPPTPSLGAMVAEGRNYWTVSFWPAVVPGAMIALIVLGLNSLGDGLRDIFDPRLRRW